jgi:hypothetical protein
VQRSPDGEAPAGADAAARQPVETEIGPLPADLWKLIGQTPPVAAGDNPALATSEMPLPIEPDNAAAVQPFQSVPAAAHPAQALETPGGPPAGPAAVQRQAVPAEAGSPLEPGAPPSLPEVAAPVSPIAQSTFPVQRQAEAVEPAGDTQAGGPAEGGQPAAGNAGAPEMDMDELARKVYGEIQRRLALEWERIRRRL